MLIIFENTTRWAQQAFMNQYIQVGDRRKYRDLGKPVRITHRASPHRDASEWRCLDHFFFFLSLPSGKWKFDGFPIPNGWEVGMGDWVIG